MKEIKTIHRINTANTNQSPSREEIKRNGTHSHISAALKTEKMVKEWDIKCIKNWEGQSRISTVEKHMEEQGNTL